MSMLHFHVPVHVRSAQLYVHARVFMFVICIYTYIHTDIHIYIYICTYVSRCVWSNLFNSECIAYAQKALFELSGGGSGVMVLIDIFKGIAV
jgi:hypothetical protein